MKLNEIIDVERDENIDQDSDGATVGTGVFSKVYPSKSDPHMVNKIARNDHPKDSWMAKRKDPYWLYADAIIDQKLNHSNPTFPRFYKAGTNKIQIEKLVDRESLNSEEVFNYVMNNFNGTGELDGSSFAFDDSPADSDMDQMLRYMAGSIASNVDGHRENEITNEDILSVVKWLKDFLVKINANVEEDNEDGTSNKYSEDIHPGNIMFRRTRNGLQLVITDPFS